MVGRTPAAVRKLASRARRQVRARRPRFDADPAQQRHAVTAFLRAARDGDLAGLIGLLDPRVVWHSDAAGRAGAPRDPVTGAAAVAAMVMRQAPRFVAHARVVTINGGRITEVDAIYNPDKLRHLRTAEE